MKTNRRTALGLGIAALATPAAMGMQDQPNKPLPERIKDALGEKKGPFYLAVHFKVKEDKGKDLEDAFKPAVEGTRKEKGNHAYDLLQDVEEKNMYVLFEHWESLDDLEEHLKADYVREALSGLGEIVDGPAKIRIFRLTGPKKS